MAKRLTEIQKEEIIQGFIKGKTIEVLSQEFNCTSLTIVRNLKRNIGEIKYKELINKNKEITQNKTNKNIDNLNLELPNEEIQEIQTSSGIVNDLNYFQESSFLEIAPIEYDIENAVRKEVSSVHISEIDFPKIVYLIVDKKIELEIKLLSDFPEWRFLPTEDLNRKTIAVYFDLQIAKRLCNKEQKVIKVPNTNVFKIVSPLLLSRGISRLVCEDKLIAL